jgi:hypothetical protein
MALAVKEAAGDQRFTITNNSGGARSGLEIEFTGTDDFTTLTLITNASGCAEPAIAYGAALTLTWNAACVDPGEAIIVSITGSVAFDSGQWTPGDVDLNPDHVVTAIECSTQDPGHPPHLSTFDADTIVHEPAIIGCVWAPAEEVEADGAPVAGKVRAKADGPDKADCAVPSKIPQCPTATNLTSCCDSGFLTGGKPTSTVPPGDGPYTQPHGTVYFRVCDKVLNTNIDVAAPTLCALPCQEANAAGVWKFDTTLDPDQWKNVVAAPVAPLNFHFHHDACFQSAEPVVGQVWQAHCHDTPGELVRSIAGEGKRECHIVMKRADGLDAYTFVVIGCGACLKTEPGNKCAGTKVKTAGKNAQCLTGLDAKAQKSGLPVDSTKEQKCRDKLSSTFSKAEAKGGCLTTGDTQDIQNKVDALRQDLLDELTVGPGPDGCASAKLKAAGRTASCLLALEAKEASKGTPVDAAKAQKCRDKLSLTFAKTESKGGCNTSGDAQDIEDKVDAYVDDVDEELAELVGSPTGAFLD